jgi:FixJ family two-component response regulator
METGCQAFVQKPYKCSDLSKVVHQVITRTGNRQ